MLPEMHAQPLILGANEDGADDIPGNKQQEKPIM